MLHLIPRPLGAALILLFVSLAAPADAAAQTTRCAGVDVPDAIRVEGRTLVLNGLGVRRVSLFGIEVFVGALYLTRTERDASAILRADAPKRLALTLKRDAPRSRLADAFRKHLGEGATVDALLAALPERVARGQRLAFTHLPGRGLEVRRGGRAHALVGDDAFATAFFAMFLGDDPADERLRRGLLEGGCP